MAIKGKSRTRARRVTTNAPKPVTVVPRKPFLARRWVRWTALGLLVLVVGTIVFLTWKNQQEKGDLQRRQDALAAFQNQLEAPLVSVRQPTPTGVLLFTEMRSALEQFKEGQVDPSTLIRDVTRWEGIAASAEEELDAIVPSREVREKGVPVSMIDAHGYILAAATLYHEAAVVLRTAAEAGPGEQRDELLGVAERLMDRADALVQSSYNKINNERFLLGIDQSPIAG